MNDFTKEELLEIKFVFEQWNFPKGKYPNDEKIQNKIQSMIDNYWLPDNVDLIGTGQLLFHNKESSSSIIPKIQQQLDLCENLDETKAFRIDWKIIYGKKFGQ